MRRETNGKNIIFTVVCYVILIFFAVICLIPFYNSFVNMTWDNGTITSSYKLLPGSYLLSNYKTLSENANIWIALLNSAIVAVSSTALSSYFGALVAYGFAVFNFRFNRGLFWVLLATMMIPSQLGIIGYFQLMSDFHLLDNFASLIIPSVASAGSVFFIHQYIKANLSKSLIESGRIDGCNELKIFHRIVLPIISPVVFTQAIFLFVSSWNNLTNPLILLFSTQKFTLPVIIMQLNGVQHKDFGAAYLAISISLIPILVVFSVFSKRIIGGLSLGAVKE